VVLGLGLFGWEVVEGGVQAFGVVPADPPDDGTFDLVSVSPGPSVLDRLGFEGAVEGLGHRVVVTVGDGTDRRGRDGLDQALAVANGHVLTGFHQS
jgi:hypothetical protein